MHLEPLGSPSPSLSPPLQSMLTLPSTPMLKPPLENAKICSSPLSHSLSFFTNKAPQLQYTTTPTPTSPPEPTSSGPPSTTTKSTPPTSIPPNHQFRLLQPIQQILLLLLPAAIQGVQEKLCFFTIHCNPSLAYIDVRDLQSSHCNTSV